MAVSVPHAGADVAVNLELTAERVARMVSSMPIRDRVETPKFVGAVRRMLRAASLRAGQEDEVELALLLSLEDDLKQAIADAVHAQRARGMSWAYIARATGKSRQAAEKRWGEN